MALKQLYHLPHFQPLSYFQLFDSQLALSFPPLFSFEFGFLCHKNTTTGGNGYIRLHNASNYVTFAQKDGFPYYGKPKSTIFPSFHPAIGIDTTVIMCYILHCKSCDEDTHFGVSCPERSRLVQGSAAARNDTTSELSGGNTGTGAPVTVRMSGGLVRNQGGTVEYIIYYVSHP